MLFELGDVGRRFWVVLNKEIGLFLRFLLGWLSDYAWSLLKTGVLRFTS